MRTAFSGIRSCLLALVTASGAASPAFAVPPAAGGSQVPVPAVAIPVQDICGALGNCGILGPKVNPLPRYRIKPDVGTLDTGEDRRFGRYRYEQPDQQLDLNVPRMQPSQRVQPRYTGSKTVYRVGKLSAEHVDWCYANRSGYRARDNTYQPSKGARKLCVSPFGK